MALDTKHCPIPTCVELHNSLKDRCCTENASMSLGKHRLKIFAIYILQSYNVSCTYFSVYKLMYLKSIIYLTHLMAAPSIHATCPSQAKVIVDETQTGENSRSRCPHRVATPAVRK